MICRVCRAAWFRSSVEGIRGRDHRPNWQGQVCQTLVEPHMSSIDSAEMSLAHVSSDTVITLWTMIYLPETTVSTGMLVCRSFRDTLPALIKTVKLRQTISLHGGWCQQIFEKFVTTFNNLESLTVQQPISHPLPPRSLDWTTVTLPHLQTLWLSYCPVIHFDQTNTPALTSLVVDHDARKFARATPVELHHCLPCWLNRGGSKPLLPAHLKLALPRLINLELLCTQVASVLQQGCAQAYEQHYQPTVCSVPDV